MQAFKEMAETAMTTRGIAVWYHCIFTGTERPINAGFTMDLMAQQMLTLERVGLAASCNELVIGVNGDEEDAGIARMLAPEKAKIIAHGKGSGTEITTLKLLREWAKEHDGWYVLYFHTKGASHPQAPNTLWRLNMERHVLHNWRNCIQDLDGGYDACGSYWLTPEEHRSWVKSPFFGGTFWWAKARYIATLPPLPEPTFVNRYDAEGFIGSGVKRPHVKNYLEGWPPQI